MSELLKHECGIALLRLLKPSQYYREKYGDRFYGVNIMKRLMNAQKHRGQDGAGIVSLFQENKTLPPLIHHFRSAAENALFMIFSKLEKDVLKSFENIQTYSEMYLGHLRYGTFGKNSRAYCHPFLDTNINNLNTLAIAGNFNLTNMNELYELHLNHSFLKSSDSAGILQIMRHYLQEQSKIGLKTDLLKVLEKASKAWDGGYVISGLLGSGDAFVIRDASGIRPAYYYVNNEVFVMASERYAIHAALDVAYDDIEEVKAGNILVLDKEGKIMEKQIVPSAEKKSCSFERIYFSHGNDPDIKKERRQLGAFLLPEISKSLSGNISNTLFSYIPQTAKVAFDGLLEQMREDKLYSSQKVASIPIFKNNPELRLFISNEKMRESLSVNSFQNLNLGTKIKAKNLILIDDSIVRGTTLKNIISKLCNTINPLKIIIASSAPQLRYPDCYGIDLAKIDELIAFQAAMALLKEKGMESLIDEVYRRCLLAEKKGNIHLENHIVKLYSVLDEDDISKKIADLIRPKEMHSELKIIFQSIDNLHRACPLHTGDWYFTGKYPTAGGNRVVNTSFMYFIEGKKKRAY